MTATDSRAVLELGATARRCDWCGGPIPMPARRDAITCSKSCRQARHRFQRGVGRSSATPVVHGRPRRIGYADPPYPGLSAKYYRDHPDYGGEVDHAELLSRLASTHDAWALSTSAAALQDVLALAPPGTMVAAWHRGERVNKYATAPLSAWEPVLYGGQILADRRGGPDDASRAPGERIDSLIYRAHPRLTDRGRVVGSKPAAFWGWLFALLDARPGDEFYDLFPGSYAGDRAWQTWIDGAP